MAFSDVVEGSNAQEALEALQEQVAFLTGKQKAMGGENDKDKGDKTESIVEDEARDPRQLENSRGELPFEEETHLLEPDASQLQLPHDRTKDVSNSVRCSQSL